jgi:hypothetical protein
MAKLSNAKSGDFLDGFASIFVADPFAIREIDVHRRRQKSRPAKRLGRFC